MERKPVIGVMGGSKATSADCEDARQLGRLIARRGWLRGRDYDRPYVVNQRIGLQLTRCRNS